MKYFATIISYLFHPVFMLTYLTSYFLFTNNYFAFFMSPAKKIFLLSAVFVFSVALPLLNVIALKKLGFLKNLYAQQASERLMPYTSALVLYGGLLYILHDLAIPFFFKYIVAVSVFVIALVFLLNFFLKISAHVAGIAGVLGTVYFYQYISGGMNLSVICALVFISGLVAFSRLYLNAHKPAQVYAGFLIGLSGSFTCLFLLLHFNIQF